MSATDEHLLEARAERLAPKLRADGFTVSHIAMAVPAIDAAKMLCVSDRTLRVWRADGEGPRWFAIGRSPFYRLTELIRYCDDRIEQSERQNPAESGSMRQPAAVATSTGSADVSNDLSQATHTSGRRHK